MDRCGCEQYGSIIESYSIKGDIVINNQKEFPKEYSYVYWARKGNSAKKGNKAPAPDSLYVKYVHDMPDGEEPLPFYTYFDNAVQLAGYVKYVVLGGIVMGLLNDIQVLEFFKNRKTNFSVADIDESLKIAELTDDVDVMIKDWIKEVLSVCDELVLEKDEEEQKILLKRIEILFNRHFAGLDYGIPTGETYELKVFFGMNEAKYDLLTYYKEHQKYNYFRELLSEKERSYTKTCEIEKILNGY